MLDSNEHIANEQCIPLVHDNRSSRSELMYFHISVFKLNQSIWILSKFQHVKWVNDSVMFFINLVTINLVTKLNTCKLT